MIRNAIPVVSTNGPLLSTELGNLGMVAGAFDEFGLEDTINKCIGKEGSHVVADNGALVKLLVMQMLNVPYQSLSATEHFYKKLPLETLAQQKVSHKDLGRSVLSRLLDSIHEYGSEDLFLTCAAQVVKSLGIKIREAHIDSTSFHYDGQTRVEQDCRLEMRQGYSRDHRPELNQAISLMLADGQSRIPFFARNVSGNINDNRSFNSLLNFSWDSLKKQFSELEYLVGDSALCTTANFKDSKFQKVKLITRVPDKTQLAQQCFDLFNPEEMQKIYENDEHSAVGRWCPDGEIGGEKVKLLLISNAALKSKKTETIRKRANTELERLQASIKKMQTKPAACKEDAEKNFLKTIAKVKFCKVSEPVYEDIMKRAKRGRPKKGEVEEKILVGVSVTAEVTLDEDKIAEAISRECLYVLATNDVKRKWKMIDLLSIYKRQSVIERNWRCCKQPQFFLDAIYLKSPSRIDALLWLMSLALLVYAAMEYKLRKALAEAKKKFPLFENRSTDKPTLRCVFQYVDFLRIQILRARDGTICVSNIDPTMQQLLILMGDYWSSYYVDEFYRGTPSNG